MNYVVLSALWLVYGMVHSALATSRLKTFSVQSLGISEKAYRIFYNLVAISSLLPLIYLGFYIGDRQIYETNLYSNVVAGFICLLGLIVMVMIIKKYFLQMSGVAEQNQEEELHTDGLHQYVRHPLYLGTFILLIGIFFYRPQINVLISTLSIILYTIFAVRWEEKKLLTKLGEKYQIYCNSTPRFIPKFFAKKEKLKN